MTKQAFLKTLLCTLIASSLFLVQGCGSPGHGSGSSDQNNNDAGNDDDSGGVADANREPIALEFDADFVDSVPRLNTLTFEFNSGGRGIDFEYNVIRAESGLPGDYEILLGDDDYFGELDTVIQARTRFGETIYAPLVRIENDQQSFITLDAFSHYVLKKLYDLLESEEALEAILTCSRSTCSDQAQIKSELLNNLILSARTYDISFSEGTTLTARINQMENTAALKDFVEQGVIEIAKAINPIHQGTVNPLYNAADPNACSVVNTDHNTVFFGIEIADITPNDSDNEISFGTYINRIEPSQTDTSFPVDFPTLQQLTQIFKIRQEAFNGLKNNFQRETLRIDQDNNLELDNTAPYRRLNSSGSVTYLTTDGNFLYDRTFIQNEPTNSDNVGRLFNPVLSKLYRANIHDCDTPVSEYSAAPNWLVTANYGSGASYSLELDNAGELVEVDERFVREEQLEAKHIFSWEIFSPQTETTFSEGALDDKEYGSIQFSVELNETGNLLTVNAGTYFWEERDGNILENQPSTHFSSFQLSRATNNATTGVNERSDSNVSVRPIYTIQDQHQRDSEPKDYGAMGLDGGTQASTGHSTQDGRYLAFSFDISEQGRGVVLASELETIVPILTTQENDTFIYQLSGNFISLSSTESRMSNVNGSVLNITYDSSTGCSATLDLKQRIASQTLADNSVSISSAETTGLSSAACRVGSAGTGQENGSEVEISFANVNGQDLTLKGFMSQNNEEQIEDVNAPPLFNLLWIQNESLGLVFATQEQGLPEGF